MKKLYIIVAALFVAVSFSSCDKDDNGRSDTPTQMRYVKQIVRVEDGRKVEFKYDNEDMLDNPVGWGPDWMLLGKQSAYLPSEFIDSENDANPNRCSYKLVQT